ncbi:MAG: hypothetical protein ABSC36_01725 [Gaiellaceae bacterium]
MQTVALIRKFVIAIGIGLTLASLRLNILKATMVSSAASTYWSSWTTRLTLLALIAACAGLLIANVMRDEGDRFLASVSGLGAILLGFFLFIPVAIGFGHLGELALGPKFGVAGGALIVLGALPARGLGSWQRSRKRRNLPLYVTWLLAVVGAALVIVSLRLVTSANSVAVVTSPSSMGLGPRFPRYWSSVGLTGGHSLGIFMLAVAIVAIAAAVGNAVLRAPVLGRWALAASLLLLGLTIYYPLGYLVGFVNISAISTGAGLAIEGGVLAAAAALIAVSAERGVIDLRELPVPRLLAVGGIALALAGTWANVWGSQGSSLWVDGTTGGLPLLLVVVSGALVAINLAFRRRWALPCVSILGWLLAGYFGTTVIQAAPDQLGTLGPATWLGMIGGVLMGLSALSLQSMAAWKRRSPSMTLRRFAPWLATGIGAGILLASLWLTAEAQSSGTKASETYWNSAGDHSLGIVMLVLGASAIVALLGVLITRLSVLSIWALAASLALLGISLFIPVSEAFHHLGTLRSGAWLALAGSLIASAGAVVLTLPELLRQAEPAEEPGKVPSPRSRPPLKGKKPRVPEMRRAR